MNDKLLQSAREFAKGRKWLYTYVPRENTVEKDGLLSTARVEDAWRKYAGRTGGKNRKEVLEALDRWQPGFRRSYGISMFSEPIPDDAHPDFRAFADAKDLYRVDLDKLRMMKVVKALQETNAGKRGTHHVDNPSYGGIDWKKAKPGAFLFSNVPHYIVETADGRISPELVERVKTASETVVQPPVQPPQVQQQPPVQPPQVQQQQVQPVQQQPQVQPQPPAQDAQNKAHIYELSSARPQPVQQSKPANLGWTGWQRPTDKEYGEFLGRGLKNGWKWGVPAALVAAALNGMRVSGQGRSVGLFDMLWPALFAYAAGHGAYTTNNWLRGMGYGDRKYDTSNLKPGDTVFIGVSGGGGGRGSDLDKDMHDALGEGNYAMFPYYQRDEAARFANSLPKGVKTVWIGHSYGGGALNGINDQLSEEARQNSVWHTIDPVGWRGKLTGIKPMGTAYYPSKTKSAVFGDDNMIANVGGRWNYPKGVVYPGTHANLGNLVGYITGDELGRKPPIDMRGWEYMK